MHSYRPTGTDVFDNGNLLALVVFLLEFSAAAALVPVMFAEHSIKAHLINEPKKVLFCAIQR